jgi:hypothetical protein
MLIILEKEYVLNSFPEGYVLWDHSAPEGESGQQKAGTRTDAYLYGHPAGRTKRFRSPQEFLPHLRWLAIGGESNCECKVCLSTPKELATSTMPRTEGLWSSFLWFSGESITMSTSSHSSETCHNTYTDSSNTNSRTTP